MGWKFRITHSERFKFLVLLILCTASIVTIMTPLLQKMVASYQVAHFFNLTKYEILHSSPISRQLSENDDKQSLSVFRLNEWTILGTTQNNSINVTVPSTVETAKQEVVSKTMDDDAKEILVTEMEDNEEIPEDTGQDGADNLDFSRLDLLDLASEDESISTAWDKQTKLEKETRYPWDANERSRRPPGFQTILNETMWIYSAFYVPAEDGKSPSLKGLGLVEMNYGTNYSNVYCHLYKEKEPEMAVKGTISIIPEHYVHNCTATWFICPLPAEYEPDSVTFTASLKDKTTNIVPVVYPGKTLLRNFTICHPAIFGAYSATERLLQIWEIYRALGADHIYIYYLEASLNTQRMLQAYERAGLLSVLPWERYPVGLAHYRSQLVAINDCVYRNRNVSKYVLVHDTDEIIVPQHNYTGWQELVRSYEDRLNPEGKKIAALGVRSSFFCRAPEHDVWQKAAEKYKISEEEQAYIHRYGLHPFRNIERGTIYFEYRVRSKNIVRPEKIITMGIHKVWTYESGYGLEVLPPEEALVFHEKTSCGIKANLTGITDARILHFYKPCSKTLKKLYQQIGPP